MEKTLKFGWIFQNDYDDVHDNVDDFPTSKLPPKTDIQTRRGNVCEEWTAIAIAIVAGWMSRWNYFLRKLRSDKTIFETMVFILIRHATPLSVCECRFEFWIGLRTEQKTEEKQKIVVVMIAVEEDE